MMKKTIYLIIYLFIASHASGLAQVSQLRYIAGYPNYNLIPNPTDDDWNVVYTSAILKQQGDSLVEVKLLCDSLHMLYYLRHYYNKNIVSAMLAGKTQKYYDFPDSTYRLLTIDTRTEDTMSVIIPDKIDTLDNLYNFYRHRLYALDLGTKLKYALVYNDFKINDFEPNRPLNFLYYILDPVSGVLKRSTSANNQYVTTNGNSVGTYLNYNGDALPLQSDTIMNLLRIPSELKIDSIYKTPIPPNVKLSKYGAFLVIDDPMVRVLYFYEYTINPSALTLRIYNKKSKTWSKLILSSSFDNKILMKNFNGWLVGAVKVKNTENFWTESKRQPGQEAWSRKRTKYSPSIYEILEVHERQWYSEGILYIYNIDNQAYIEWNTQQADSEILLVDDNKVYYRKYDEIYEVPVVKGKALGKHRLIVKNKYVPAIHFMFKTKGK